MWLDLGACVFITDGDVPMGMTLDDGVLSMEPEMLFNFNLADGLEENFWSYSGSTWKVQLFGGDDDDRNVNYNRHDSIIHPTRGVWFDGKYDFQTLKNATMSPFTYLFLWVRADSPGTLFS